MAAGERAALPATDPLHPDYATSPYRGAEPSPIAVTIVRAAAILLLCAFFLPWGEVWVSNGCDPRNDYNTLGTVRGPDIATGKAFPLPGRQREAARPLTLQAQPIAYIIPIVAVIVFVVPFVTMSARLTRRMVYGVYATVLVSAGVAVVIFARVTERLTIPADQQSLLGTTTYLGELPQLRLDLGWGGMLAFVMLQVIIVTSLAALALQWQAARGPARAVERPGDVPLRKVARGLERPPDSTPV
jgi:hypothetical protein